MRRYEVRTTRTLQIEGFEGEAPGDTVIATIHTDCNIGSIISALQFGNATMVDPDSANAAATEDVDAPAASAADAPPTPSATRKPSSRRQRAA